MTGTVVGEVTVPGVPAPQGSAKAYVVKGHAVVTHDNENTMPWRSQVSAFVRQRCPTISIPEGGVWVELEFRMPRRAAEPKRVTPAHTRKPDLDKLVRACLDAMTGLAFTDDNQVVNISAVKRTALAAETPGVWIRWGHANGYGWAA
jgi:crossover junction endodeoxyribonuclease RusA